jgi:hypothetical protein
MEHHTIAGSYEGDGIGDMQILRCGPGTLARYDVGRCIPGVMITSPVDRRQIS